MTPEQRLLWDWVQDHLTKVLGVAPESISLEKGLSTYGIDSVDAVLMAGELEEAFDIEIDPARFLQCDSFAALIAVLASDMEKSARHLVGS